VGIFPGHLQTLPGSWPRDQTSDADEFCLNTSYHRKYAIRLLNGPPPGKQPERRPRGHRPRYGQQVLSILAGIWEAAGYPWSVRLKALLPSWMPWIRKRYRVSPQLEKQLLRIRARQIERRLKAKKSERKRRIYGRTKPGCLLKHHIPVKTDSWDVQAPGFTEIDLVSHSGNSGEGEFAHSLNLTDIHSGWTESRALLGGSQVAVQQALDEIEGVLPFRLLGLDSDNGSEFINWHLKSWCEQKKIQLTRGRPYKKDDNAHVEQKNWTHVRKLLGWERYDSRAAVEAINDLYRHELRLWLNLYLLGQAGEKNSCGIESAPRLRCSTNTVGAGTGYPAGPPGASGRTNQTPAIAGSVSTGPGD
jgi:transposase InsO family protein